MSESDAHKEMDTNRTFRVVQPQLDTRRLIVEPISITSPKIIGSLVRAWGCFQLEIHAGSEDSTGDFIMFVFWLLIACAILNS